MSNHQGTLEGLRIRQLSLEESIHRLQAELTEVKAMIHLLENPTYFCPKKITQSVQKGQGVFSL